MGAEESEMVRVHVLPTPVPAHTFQPIEERSSGKTEVLTHTSRVYLVASERHNAESTAGHVPAGPRTRRMHIPNIKFAKSGDLNIAYER